MTVGCVMGRVVLHIGLHKTATTLLQDNVFPSLPVTEIASNPSDIVQYLSDCIKAEDLDDIKYRKEDFYNETFHLIEKFKINNPKKGHSCFQRIPS